MAEVVEPDAGDVSYGGVQRGPRGTVRPRPVERQRLAENAQRRPWAARHPEPNTHAAGWLSKVGFLDEGHGPTCQARRTTRSIGPRQRQSNSAKAQLMVHQSASPDGLPPRTPVVTRASGWH